MAACRGECPERSRVCAAKSKGYQSAGQTAIDIPIPCQYAFPMPFYVYILRMNDGRLYVGHSNNPPRRHAEHEQGKGCRTTGIFGAGDIVFVEEHPDRISAARRERQVKGWTRAKKLALAAGNLSELHELAKRRA